MSLQPYPLYEELLEIVERNNKNAVNRRGQTLDIMNICSTINSISDQLSKDDAIDHYKELYLIIYYYYVKSNGGSEWTFLPKGMKELPGGLGCRCQFTSLDYKLQQIINEYIKKYSISN